jgi:hypothetical protein
VKETEEAAALEGSEVASAGGEPARSAIQNMRKLVCCMLTYVVCEVCQNYRKKDKKYVPVGDVSESCPEAVSDRKRIELSIRNELDGNLEGPYVIWLGQGECLCAVLEGYRSVVTWYSVRSVNLETSPSLDWTVGGHHADVTRATVNGWGASVWAGWTMQHRLTLTTNPVRPVEFVPLQQRVLEEAPPASEAHAERSEKRRKSEKQVRHAEGAAARATGARANEPSSHSAGVSELATFDVELAGVDTEERTRESARARDRVSFSLLSKKELEAFEKQFPSFCCPLCTSPLT